MVTLAADDNLSTSLLLGLTTLNPNDAEPIEILLINNSTDGLAFFNASVTLTGEDGKIYKSDFKSNGEQSGPYEDLISFTFPKVAAGNYNLSAEVYFVLGGMITIIDGQDFTVIHKRESVPVVDSNKNGATPLQTTGFPLLALFGAVSLVGLAFHKKN
ncbi:MAG: hypothetical protein LBT10_07905 [Methanobrevibacter sp.]|jgi:hypothetical protein|nr:hypothetical protein [Methanobrevibacter sp.]